MKQVKNLIVVSVLMVLTNSFAAAQTINRDAGDVYQTSNTTTGTTDIYLASTDPAKRTMNVELDRNRLENKSTSTERKANAIQIQIGRFITKNSKVSFSTPKKLSDGSFVITIKDCSSSIGNVAIKEAKIIYNDQGIVSLNMQLDKLKAKTFIDAHLAKYGKPNNENTLDNYSWVLGGFVLEVLENESSFSATYQKYSPQLNYVNEGVNSTLF